MTAFVRGVISRRTDSTDMHHVSGSTSAKIGVAPTYVIGAAVAIHVVSGTITSSPGPMPWAIRLRCSPAVHDGSAIAKRRPVGARELLLEGPALDAGALEPGVAGGVGDGLDLALGDPRTGDRDRARARPHHRLGGRSHRHRSRAIVIHPSLRSHRCRRLPPMPAASIMPAGWSTRRCGVALYPLPGGSLLGFDHPCRARQLTCWAA